MPLGFPGKAPDRWDQITPAQRAWFEARQPWLFDGRTPRESPRQVLARAVRGEAWAKRCRLSDDPLAAGWSSAMSKHLTK
jgi:hypothetical protein